MLLVEVKMVQLRVTKKEILFTVINREQVFTLARLLTMWQDGPLVGEFVEFWGHVTGNSRVWCLMYGQWT